MRIRIAISALAFALSLGGCVSTGGTPLMVDCEAMASELNKKVIDCTAPFLEAHSIAKANISYRYRDGSIAFSSDMPSLTTHLGQCATPSSGPDGTFDREIEIWSTNKQ